MPPTHIFIFSFDPWNQ